jgi:hypothetical protein
MSTRSTEECERIATRIKSLGVGSNDYKLFDKAAAALRELARERDALAKQVDSAWQYITNGWDIEPREWFEEQERSGHGMTALALACHHVQKRECIGIAAERDGALSEQIAQYETRYRTLRTGSIGRGACFVGPPTSCCGKNRAPAQEAPVGDLIERSAIASFVAMCAPMARAVQRDEYWRGYRDAQDAIAKAIRSLPAATDDRAGHCTMVTGTLGMLLDEITTYAPGVCSGVRWTAKELDQLQHTMNCFGLLEVADALGSLRFALADAAKGKP